MPSTLHIRSALPTDFDAVRALHVAAFHPSPAEAALVDLLHAAHKASLSLVLTQDNQILAHIIFSPMSLTPTQPQLSVVGLAPVAVLPTHYNRGLGRQLIHAGIAACKAANHHAIAVLGDPRFYTRFGFQPALPPRFTNDYVQDHHFMILELVPHSLPTTALHLRDCPEFQAAGC